MGECMDLLIKNIGVLATAKGSVKKCGKEQSDIFIDNNMCIGIENGVIKFVGEEKDAPVCKNELDAKGNLVTAGLVDAHTHLVFGGFRQNELGQKLDGVPYLDILRNGGGILSSVNSTRNASEDELFEKALKITNKMLEYGTTTVEAKSGYGLNLEDELKQLRVAKRLNENSKIDVVSTAMPAHAVPPEFKENKKGYIDLMVNEILPKIKEENLAVYADIFCETAVFDVEESKFILEKARELGFLLKMHADEIDPIGGAELAGELSLASAEHLIQASDLGIKKMSEGGVIGVCLPATSFYLDKPFAKAKQMINEGMAVAVASDFNPGSSPNFNLQLAMMLSAHKYKLTPKEALMAVTLNSACAIGVEKEVGTIEVGKKADIVIWDAPDLDFLFYRYGDNLVDTVIKNGEVL